MQKNVFKLLKISLKFLNQLPHRTLIPETGNSFFGYPLHHQLVVICNLILNRHRKRKPNNSFWNELERNNGLLHCRINFHNFVQIFCNGIAIKMIFLKNGEVVYILLLFVLSQNSNLDFWVKLDQKLHFLTGKIILLHKPIFMTNMMVFSK